MDYMDIANSSLAYIMAAIIILAVIIQTSIFIKKGWRRATDLGVSKETLNSTVKNSISVSILPSLPIVLSVVILVPLLGIPTPWVRLSVIGSAMFEMFAADLGAKAAGAGGLGGEGFGSFAFINAVWVMSIGGVSSLLFSLFFIKPISTSYEKAKQRDGKWMLAFGNAALAAVVITTMTERISVSKISALVVISGFVFVLICNKLSKYSTIFKDYALTFGMVFGMFMAIVFTAVL